VIQTGASNRTLAEITLATTGTGTANLTVTVDQFDER
jgi:hypothetical protein